MFLKVGSYEKLSEVLRENLNSRRFLREPTCLGEPSLMRTNPVNQFCFLKWQMAVLIRNTARSSGRTSFKKHPSILLKTVSENRFSGKTYLYTIASSFSVKCHLNLRDIALRGHNVEYRRENGVGSRTYTHFVLQGTL